MRTIIYDKNNITLQGYADIVHALEKNCSVRHMPFPIYDLQPCMKTSAEKTEQLAKKIQDLLQRNVTPCKYSHGQAFRLQQGFLLSSTQQMVDRLVVQTQDTIKAIAAESCDANNDINYATGLIQDADNSKQLLPRLHEVLQRRDENNPIELKLHEMANELHKVVTIYLQDSLDAMIKCANEQCPTILSQTVIRGDESESVAVEDDLRSSCKEKNQISSEFIHTTITEQAGADIVNRVNELNLAVAAHVSDRITDEVIESLSRSYKNLIGDCDSRTRSSTPDVLRPSAGSMSSGSVIGVTSTVGVSTALPVGRTSIASEEDCPPETYSLVNSIGQCSSDQSPMATPHLSNKRKSLHGRKLRPKSVVDSVEGLSADDIPDLLPSLPKSQAEAISETEHSLTESLDSVSELPNTVGQQLQHLVKSRPRRTKTRAPTRPMLRPDQPVDGLALGEGLDVFFRPTTPTTPLISPTSDDSSLHTFPTDGSPNLSLTSHKSIPPETDKKPGCSSPMLKTLLEPAPRSRSSDNLEKFSPLVGRRSQGDSPLTASPLTRRNTTDNAQNHERILTKSDSNKDTSNNVCNNCVGSTADTSKRSTLPIIGSGTSTRSLRDSDENSKVLQQTTATNSSDKDATAVPKDYEIRKSLTKKSAVDTDKTANQPLPSLKLRSTGFDLRSPTNGSSTKSNSEASKSPVLRSLTKGNSSLTDGKSNGALSKTKPVPPITAPKPRPWSMATDRKSGEFNLLSDGSSPNTSAGNTPDSGDALDESTDSGVSGPASLPPTLSASSTASSLSNASVEKRSVRELAASLNKSKTERKENGNGSAENG